MTGQQVVKIIGAERRGEIETLRHRAAQHSEPGELTLGLHSLSHGRYTHGVSQVNDGPDNGRVHRALDDALHESAVHLNFLHRELLQVGE